MSFSFGELDICSFVRRSFLSPCVACYVQLAIYSAKMTFFRYGGQSIAIRRSVGMPIYLGRGELVRGEPFIQSTMARMRAKRPVGALGVNEKHVQ